MKYLSLGLLCVLAGCSSPSVTHYYQLPVMDRVQPQSTLVQHTSVKNDATLKTFYIEPIHVASYLNGQGIVMQLSDVQLMMARQHLWLEPLDKQLQRQLRDRLQNVLPDYLALLEAKTGSVNVQLHLERFHGLENGYATIGGRYSINAQQSSYLFDYQVALESDGYDALVNALSQGLDKLTLDIKAKISGN